MLRCCWKILVFPPRFTYHHGSIHAKFLRNTNQIHNFIVFLVMFPFFLNRTRIFPKRWFLSILSIWTLHKSRKNKWAVSEKNLKMSSFWPFWSLVTRFGADQNFPAISGFVTFEPLWTPNSMHETEKTNEPIPRKVCHIQRDGLVDLNSKDPAAKMGVHQNWKLAWTVW